MTFSRRTFLSAAAANAAALAIIPEAATAGVPSDLTASSSSDEWNFDWPSKLTGKYKAVFDATEIESGYGVWRAAAWARQYGDFMKAAPADLSPVIVLRHNAISLAMQQAYWDKYTIGRDRNVTHPLTGDPTDKNPALLDEKDGIPAPFDNASLRKQLDRGVIVLACNLALQDCADRIQKADKVDAAEAHKRAVGYLVPGVILQPSGVFAVTRAQEAGASYVKAS
jgi:intracellular sulfur oxidation DsrE/DsrF family protein